MPSSYWEQRILADERRATEIAQHASEEMAKMYRAQYLRVVKEIEKLKGEIDYGRELTRTQLWNYARWRKVEESLKGFVTEAVTIDTQVIHDALEREFERVIGKPASDYGGALGRAGNISMSRLEKARILSGEWSGEHYSARIWKNSNAIADRMRNEITDMLVDGKSTQDIRRAVMREFGVSYRNADKLVRTEVSYVHNQTTLARYKEMGQTQVSILIVEDGKACDICRELPGKPYDIDSAPFLPAHPRCRCCYAPWTILDRKKWAEEHPEEGAAEVQKPELPKPGEGPKPLQNQAENGIIAEEAELQRVRDMIRSDATNKTIIVGRQNKHLRESKGYIPGRSYLTITLEDAQRYVNELAGTGKIRLSQHGVWTRKEVVDAGQIIGVDVNEDTGEETETSLFIIHYADKGVHIVPTQWRKKP